MRFYDFRDRHDHWRAPSSAADRDPRLGTAVQVLEQRIRLLTRCRHAVFGKRLQVFRRLLCELWAEEIFEEKFHLPPSASSPLVRRVVMGTTGVRSAPPRLSLLSRWGRPYSRKKYATTLEMRRPTITETESAALASAEAT